MVVTETPVGTTQFIVTYLRGILETRDGVQPELVRLARHISLFNDKQVALRITRMCLAPRVMHLARSTAPSLFKKLIARPVDALTVHCVQSIAQLPQRQPLEELVQRKLAGEPHSDTCSPQLQQQQYMQMFIPLSSGGLGMMDTEAIAEAAFL